MSSDDTAASPYDAQILNITIGLAVPGIALSVALLSLFAYLAWNRTSRGHLNRVSFRLLVYSLISHAIYASILTWSTSLTGPSAACTFVAFVTDASLMFSACMFFCMSLNLQLVLVHGVDGLRMEKFYLLGSALLTAITKVTPLAAGQYGFSSHTACWFTNPDPMIQVRWLVGTQIFWLLLMASWEVVSFIVLVTFMVRHQMRTGRVLSGVRTSSTLQPVVPVSALPLVRYRGMILRIGLYPLFSCALNFSGCLLDLYLTQAMELTPVVRRLGIMDVCIFSMRALLYALLGATDPSFLRALRALRVSDRSSSAQTTSVQSVGSHRAKRFSFGSQADRQSVDTAVGGRPKTGRGKQEKAEMDAKSAADPEPGLRPGDAPVGRLSSGTPEGIECQI